jgi:hypothetical protein
MNWKLIFVLSIAGVIDAIASAYGLLGKAEPVFWVLVWVLYALVIARKTTSRRFLHGFTVSVLNGIWIGLIHSAMVETYSANNPEMMESYRQMPGFLSAMPPGTVMLIMGPVIGALTGLIAGGLAALAGKLMKMPQPQG